jgi:hypothetical protein
MTEQKEEESRRIIADIEDMSPGKKCPKCSYEKVKCWQPRDWGFRCMICGYFHVLHYDRIDEPDVQREVDKWMEEAAAEVEKE